MTALPKWVRVADQATWVLLLVGVVVLVSGGFRWEVLGISVRSADRPIALALALTAFRHLRVRRPTLWDRFEDVLQRTPAVWGVRNPPAPDELDLFPAAATGRRRGMELGAVTLFYAVLVALVTYPQIVQLGSVPDPGDPLFSTWRLAWVAHQLPRDPLHLFDGNIFHPERLTLTYSDAMLVPGLIAAPLLWLGVHQLHVYNLLLLAAFVLSGTAMFVLVRSLTGRADAALVAGTIFALYPFRFEHYSHLELQITFWIPFLLLAVHRVFARGRSRDGIAAGVLLAAQALSSLYYGAFLTVYLVPLVTTLALRSRVTVKASLALAVGMMVAAALVAPVAVPYVANRALVGERPPGEVAVYSAVPEDYLRPHPRSPYFGVWDMGRRQAERELFPTFTPVCLAAAGMWLPLSAARIGYVMALAISFEASLGTNGSLYPALRSSLPPFRGLRVPARFSLLVGLTLAVLGGYGVARLTRSMRPPGRWVTAAAILAVAVVELKPSLALQPAWHRPPGIYGPLEGAGDVVLAEFPLSDVSRPDDARATYFSTFHWQPIVNGISGHYPLSYIQLLLKAHSFPAEPALEYLRARRVTHVAVHGAFYGDRAYQAIVRALDRRSDVTLLASAPFEGSESRLYRLSPAVAPAAR